MRLIGCVNAYQDGKLLARCLPALRRVVDFLVVVDGAYEGFPPYSDVTAASVDDTINVALKYADVVVLPPRENGTDRSISWPSEIVKRSTYLVGQRDDYYFVVDADEVVEVQHEDGTVNPDGKIDVADLVEKDDWLVWTKRVSDTTRPYPIHRLFRHRDGIRYIGAHHALHVGFPPTMIDQRALEAEAPDSVFPRLCLAHYWDQRDQDRVERKGRYYMETLTPSEKQFRAAHGLGR